MDIKILEEIEVVKNRLEEITDQIDPFARLFWEEVRNICYRYNYISEMTWLYGKQVLSITVDTSYRGDQNHSCMEIPIAFFEDPDKFINEHKEKLSKKREKEKIAADQEVECKELAKLKELKEKYEGR